MKRLWNRNTAVGTGVLVCVAAVFAVGAFGQLSGFNHYNLSMVDESGRTYTTSTTVTVYAAGTSTSKTVYADANKTAIGSKLTSIQSGVIDFWCDLPAVDLVMTSGEVVVRRVSIGPTDGPIVVPETRAHTLTLTGASLTFEGDTHDDYETTLSVTDPTADRAVVFADTQGTVILSSLATNAAGAANSVTGGTNTLIFEGATGDGTNVTNLAPADPSGANTVTLPDASGTVILSSLATNAPGVANSVTGGSNKLIFEGATGDGTNVTNLAPADPSGANTLTLPDASGTVILSSLATNAPGVANSVTGASNGLVFEGASGDAYSTTLTPADPGASATVTIPANTGTIPVACSAVGTPSASVTLDFTVAPVYTLVPDQTGNILATTAPAGTICALVITTSGTSTYTLTFTTNFKTTGTLATGASDGKVFVVTFVSDGTTMHEAARTTAM